MKEDKRSKSFLSKKKKKKILTLVLGYNQMRTGAQPTKISSLSCQRVRMNQQSALKRDTGRTAQQRSIQGTTCSTCSYTCQQQKHTLKRLQLHAVRRATQDRDGSELVVKKRKEEERREFVWF